MTAAISLSKAGHAEGLEIEVHAAGLDLGEIQHRVDQLQKVLAGRVDLPEVGNEGLWPEVLGFFLQHLAVADDGVERRAQLVGHAGQERGLVAIGDLDLLKEARVLDGQGGLGGEGLEQAHDLGLEAPRRLAHDDEAAQDASLAEQRHGQERAMPREDQGLLDPGLVSTGRRDVGDLDGLGRDG